MRYARSEPGGNVAIEIIELPEGVEVSDAFHPEFVDLLRPVGDEVLTGWVFADGAWSAPVAPTATKPELFAYAASKRWDVENGGISVGGVPIATDDRSKTMIMGARIKADADTGYTVRWKTAAGFVTLAASDIVNISDAVLNHIDASFNAEADVFGLIDAGEISTTQEIDEYDWPS